jgi:hypothetical protein
MHEQGYTGSFTVATFTDQDRNDTANMYTATVDWGNGITTDVGSGIVQDPDPTIGFDVNVSFSTTPLYYLQEGSYPVTVTIRDADGSTAIAHTTANVGENLSFGTFATIRCGTTPPGPCSDTDSSGTVQFNGRLMSFTDGFWDGVGNFQAIIDWGDGSPTSTGTITNDCFVFWVAGVHTYTNNTPNPLTFHATVTVTDLQDGSVGSNGSDIITQGRAPFDSLEDPDLSISINGDSFSGAIEGNKIVGPIQVPRLPTPMAPHSAT